MVGKIVGRWTQKPEERGTIEYISEKHDNQIVWQTCKADKPSVVQIGTGSADYALKAALQLYPDYGMFQELVCLTLLRCA